MKNPISKFLKNLEDKNFDAGYRLGYDDCQRKGMKLSFGKSKGLSKKEYDDVIEFLTKKNVEIRYNLLDGGLTITRS